MERRRLGGDVRALVSVELEDRGFLAAFTERTGGASSAPFDSLNLGAHTGDEPALILENHQTAALALGVGALAIAKQVHGSTLIHIEEAGTAAGSEMVPGPLELGEADGLTTSSSSVPLAVMVADCVPLALASERDGRVAAIHVGWRGLASGIVQRAVSSFSAASGVIAAIGPSIGPCHYEVGNEVVSAVRDGTDGMALTQGEPVALDLPGTVEAVLRRGGVQGIDRASECTACERDRFFSHRRDGLTGRQALVAVRL